MNPEIEDYRVIVGPNLSELSEWVKKFIAVGYELQGGAFKFNYPRKYFVFPNSAYGQAMIKRKKETV